MLWDKRHKKPATVSWKNSKDETVSSLIKFEDLGESLVRSRLTWFLFPVT